MQLSRRGGALNVSEIIDVWAKRSVHISLFARVSGVVAERNVLVGQEVRADQVTPLLTISDLDTLWVLADVYEQDLELVQAGAEVKAEVPAYPGQVFRGRVGHVGEVVDPATRTVKLRCVVPNREHRLKPEMLAKIEIPAGDRKVIAIPSSAVLTDGGKTRVIVASDDHIYRPRDVDVGPERNDRVRVLGGVRPGERIVTQGALFLQQEIQTQ